jgi:hypothetical protein
MAVTQKTLHLTDQLRIDLSNITDRQVRDLVQAWVTAWNQVSPDLNVTLLEMLIAGDQITRAQMLRSERLKKTLVLIRDQLEALASTGATRILGDLNRAIDIAGGAQATIIDSQLPPNAAQILDLQAWSRVDGRAFEAIVKRSTKQISSRFNPLPHEVEAVVKRELIRGYAAGSNPRATAARIMARTENRFNGGLTRAMAIARTETLSAAREGALMGRMQHADVLAGWSWHCELSERSCIACISMDGTVFPNDAPGPDDHVNGRCVAVPQTKSWAELGFDIPEPAPIRVNGEEWFNSLDASVQERILGPRRYAAWSEGRYPTSDWATLHHNPDWRDSWQVSPAPKAGKTAAA